MDDDSDGRSVVRMFLEQSGARVTAVASATRGWRRSGARRPDILISDLAMPGMDGYELIRQVRALPGAQPLPSIALTAHASADVRIKAFKADFDAYLTKPVDRSELIAIVVRLARR